MTFHAKCVDDGLLGRIRALRFYPEFLKYGSRDVSIGKSACGPSIKASV